ncbi:hypothetical protein AU255_07470 [Methyloprofundus sedimenti]|uniref:Uncharacterized protein n=1 Tax=Methyloprofundus sedimenti TaxID=1420851 RepID=A0A1V8M862_9GAMM|nr:hypothetical protein [Methyloprofundus sedimenti]OQK17696.1 hypothetical protein AU255_07470 [Methyloprofundus sedimenti]
MSEGANIVDSPILDFAHSSLVEDNGLMLSDPGYQDLSLDVVIQRLRYIHANPMLLKEHRQKLQDRDLRIHSPGVHPEYTAITEQRAPAYGWVSYDDFKKAYEHDLSLFESQLKVDAKLLGNTIYSRRSGIVSSIRANYQNPSDTTELAAYIAQMLVVAQGIPLPLTVELKSLLANNIMSGNKTSSGKPLFFDTGPTPDTQAEVEQYVLPDTYDRTIVQGSGDTIGGRSNVGKVINTKRPKWEGVGGWLKEWTFYGLSPFRDRREGLTKVLGVKDNISKLRQRLISKHPIIFLLRHYEPLEYDSYFSWSDKGYFLANSVRMTNVVNRHFRIMKVILRLHADLKKSNKRFSDEFIKSETNTIDWFKYKPVFESAGLPYFLNENDPLLGAVKEISSRFQSKTGWIDWIEFALLIIGLITLLALPLGFALSPIFLGMISTAGVGTALHRAVEARINYQKTTSQSRFTEIDPFLKVVEVNDKRNLTSFFLALECISIIPVSKLAKLIWKPVQQNIDSTGKMAREVLEQASKAKSINKPGLDNTKRLTLESDKGIISKPHPKIDSLEESSISARSAKEEIERLKIKNRQTTIEQRQTQRSEALRPELQGKPKPTKYRDKETDMIVEDIERQRETMRKKDFEELFDDVQPRSHASSTNSIVDDISTRLPPTANNIQFLNQYQSLVNGIPLSGGPVTSASAVLPADIEYALKHGLGQKNNFKFQAILDADEIRKLQASEFWRFMKRMGNYGEKAVLEQTLNAAGLKFLGEQIYVDLTIKTAKGRKVFRIIDMLCQATEDNALGLKAGQFVAIEAKAFYASAGHARKMTMRGPRQLTADAIMFTQQTTDSANNAIAAQTRFAGKAAAAVNVNGRPKGLSGLLTGSIPTIEIQIPITHMGKPPPPYWGGAKTVAWTTQLGPNYGVVDDLELSRGILDF